MVWAIWRGPGIEEVQVGGRGSGRGLKLAQAKEGGEEGEARAGMAREGMEGEGGGGGGGGRESSCLAGHLGDLEADHGMLHKGLAKGLALERILLAGKGRERRV